MRTYLCHIPAGLSIVRLIVFTSIITLTYKMTAWQQNRCRSQATLVGMLNTTQDIWIEVHLCLNFNDFSVAFSLVCLAHYFYFCC